MRDIPSSPLQRRQERAGKCVSEKIKYTDEPLDDLNLIDDVLPPPEDLAFRDEGSKSPLH